MYFMKNLKKDKIFCPNCKSLNCIKKGLLTTNIKVKQRYYCKDCKKYFIKKDTLIPKMYRKAYEDYILKNLILKDLSKKYHKSIPTLIKYFDLIGKKHNNYFKVINNKINLKSINLVFDGTFFKEK